MPYAAGGRDDNNGGADDHEEKEGNPNLRNCTCDGDDDDDDGDDDDDDGDDDDDDDAENFRDHHDKNDDGGKYFHVNVYASFTLPLVRSKSCQRNHHALQPVSGAILGFRDWDRFGMDVINCLT